jgi:hypothetical protein
MPSPEGGTIVDGTYVLVATHQYVPSPTPDGFTQSSIRYFGGATQVEQIDQAIPFSFASNEPPHRLMSVTADGTTLHFSVTCPDRTHVITPMFNRGFTVHGAEVWLFQPNTIQVYAPRP